VKKNIFHLILSKDESSVSRLLLKNRAIINEVDKMGRTPLMEAVIQRQLDICRVLVQAGSNVNAREVRNWTALHFAAQEYDYEIVKYLIANGAEINAEDVDGNTPLFRCLFGSQGRGEVIKLMIEKGADKDHKNKSGVSPWDLAQKVTNFDLKQYFTNGMAKSKPPIV
jgi:uncharacterized protein